MSFQNKTKKELIEELQRMNQLLDSNKKPVGPDGRSIKQLEFLYGERMKELKCHNEMTRLFQNKNLSIG